jgi:hypothetical protein
MNLHFSPARPRTARALSAVAIGLVVVQLLLLQHSDAARLVDAIPAKLLIFIVFGAIAALIWLATQARWPLIAWAVFVLFCAIDQNQQASVAGDNPIAAAAASRAALPVLMR